MSRLDEVDLSLKLSKEQSDQKLIELQQRMLRLRLNDAGLLDSTRLGPPILVAFEGWDASGKGGSIKRLVAGLDPRHVAVDEFGVPTEQERPHHFLWRFWKVLPGRGEMSVFDRTWYGRVLVERVEELITKEEYERSYDEIVDFERSIVSEGTVLVKFWLHISPDEQLRRFEDRANDPLRSWKLTEDDWHNRSKRPAYEKAVEEMLKRTDHPDAPWDIIAAESKHFARVRVLETVIDRVENALRAS